MRRLDLSNEFGEKLCVHLSVAELSFYSHKVFCTPRRLTVMVSNLDVFQKDQFFERKCPNKANAFDETGNPTKAAIGFARSCGVEVDQLNFEPNTENPKLLFREKRAGLQTTELLQEIIETTVSKLTIPKRMRWNETAAEFIRPVRWLVVLFGKDAVSVNLFGQIAGNETFGHRFHHPTKISIDCVSDYLKLLKETGYVLVDFNERQKNIIEQVNLIAAKANAKPLYTQNLLDEITSLVEWPHALLGSFDTKFLDIPEEVLISTMQDKQKYIPLLSDNNVLIPKFIIRLK